jgi:PAS domain S-box-containing protein
MASGIVFGKRGSVWALLAVLAFGIAYAFAEQSKLIIPIESDRTTFEHVFIAALTLLMIVVFQTLYSRTLANSVEELSEELRSRKRAEAEVGRSRAILSSVLDSTTDLITALDQHYRIIAVNKPLITIVKAMMGFEPSVGMHIDRILPENRRPEIIDVYKRVFEGERVRLESHFLLPDGKEVYFDESYMPITGSDGSVQGISSFSRDITERRRIELALQSSEERYRSIVENATIFVAEVNGSGTYVYANSAHRVLLGYEPSYLLGKRMSDFVHPEDAAIVADKSHHRESTAFRFRSAAGSYRWLEATVQPLMTSSGETRVVLLGSDVTDRISAEIAKKSLEEQLLQSQKLEAIGTLAGGIAHDFNNILVSLLGNAELAKQKATADHPVQKYLSRLLEGAERARGLVQQILSFSRQSGESERQATQMHAVAQEALKLMRASIPATIRIQTEWLEPGPYIHVDPTQIHQVIVNLCTNAAHAMEAGGGILTVTEQTRTITDPDQRFSPDVMLNRTYVVLTVSDTGTGINPVILPRIFEPFFTTKNPGKGTGLGVSVVHGIVRRHDGAIRVESDVGKGTTFEVYLPKYEGLVSEVSTINHVANVANSEHLLVVDDQREMLITIEEIFTDLGYRVTSFENALDALAAFQGTPDDFDLVVTDLTMPHMTGIDLARSIHALREDIPIILTTGYQRIEDPESIKRLGIKEIVPKPFRVESIAVLLRSILQPGTTA